MKRDSLRFENLELRIVLDGLALGGPPDFVAATVVPAADKADREVQVMIPAHAQELAPGVFALGEATDPATGKIVEGLAFVQYRKSFGHKPNSPPDHGGGGGKGGKGGDGGSQCFEVLAKGAKWKTAEDYLVADEGGLPAAIDQAVSTWQSEAAETIFGNNGGTAVDGADSAAPDGKNEVQFGPIAEEGVVAVTITWGIFSGPPRGRELVEWDQVYDNDGDFTFGDADGNLVMDLLGVGVHEVGHAAGLGHPDDSCTEETMYAFVAVGETKKRTLEAGDIAGIQSLYGAADPAAAVAADQAVVAVTEPASDRAPFTNLPNDAPPVGETPKGRPRFEQLPEHAPPVEQLPPLAPPHSLDSEIDLTMVLEKLFSSDEPLGSLL